MSDDHTLQKADFGAIYNRPDPRAYFRTLEPYDYAIPQYGVDAVAALLGARGPGSRPTVLDLCCSYGIVGALLRTGLSMRDLYEHYGSPAADSLSADEMADADRRMLAEHALPSAPRVIGLDVAPNAVEYAVRTGAVDAGFTEDLERTAPSPPLADELGDVTLVTVTGGVGYVTERTFEQLMRNCPAGTWVASFCLRTYDYGPVAAALAEHGLRTERLPKTFPQRRFVDETEARWAVSRVAERGLDPAEREASGYHHADLFVSRPDAEADAVRLDELLAGLL